jgi:hypothetical protein
LAVSSSASRSATSVPRSSASASSRSARADDLAQLRVALLDDALALGEQRFALREEALEVLDVVVRAHELRVALDHHGLACLEQPVEPDQFGRRRRSALELGFAGIREQRERGGARRKRGRVLRRDDEEVHRHRHARRLDARGIAHERLGAVAAAFVPHRRAEPDALRVPGDRRERDAQQPLELGAVVLVAVERIHVAARFRVLGPVRRRQHQHAVGGQHARELREHARLVGRIEVLDRLERDDHVDAGVRQRQLGGRALHERQVADRPVGLARMRDRRLVDVDAGHLAGDGREQRAAVAFAAGGVQHALPVRVSARVRIAVDVLVDDLAPDAGDEALAGERQVVRHRSGLVAVRASPRGKNMQF